MENFKQLFFKYLEDINSNSVYAFQLGSKYILSFEGSDGPYIKDNCLQVSKNEKYSDPDSVDKYIKESCDDLELELPKITFKEYLNKKGFIY